MNPSLVLGLLGSDWLVQNADPQSSLGPLAAFMEGTFAIAIKESILGDSEIRNWQRSTETSGAVRNSGKSGDSPVSGQPCNPLFLSP